MREELLAYLWKTQNFRRDRLKTTNGEELIIVKPGQENAHAGPDFFNAHVQINKILWVGNVELHVKASDWFNHSHQLDANYDNVVLHVVWDADVPVFNPIQQPIATLCLSNYAPENFATRYLDWLAQTNKWILCADELHKLPKVLRKQFFERVYVERLMEKTTLFQSWLALTHNNWEAVFFIALAKGFGLKQNAMAFAQMALSIPWLAMQKTASKVEDLEALLMGQAGLFRKPMENEYFHKLQKNHTYLKHKYQLNPPYESATFFRLRPTNFPTIRLAQLAWLLHEKPRILTLVQSAKNLDDWYTILDAKTSSFWDTHYHFDTPSKKRVNKLTKPFKQLLLLNTIFPFLFQYYSYLGDSRKSDVIDWVRKLPPEKNRHVTNFKQLGCPIDDALESQACIQLKQNYCSPKRCLKCAFGHKLLNL
ncbi:MAG: Uncharacterised protein [Bacteroidota bacterium]|nr:MAG: Uncharacterised protein [Bacteroidota bacterium]